MNVIQKKKVKIKSYNNHNEYQVIFKKKIKDKKINNRNENTDIQLARSLNIGYYLVTPLLLGLIFGFWLDSFFKTKPIFLLLFFFLGVLVTFYSLWKIVKEYK